MDLSGCRGPFCDAPADFRRPWAGPWPNWRAAPAVGTLNIFDIRRSSVTFPLGLSNLPSAPLPKARGRTAGDGLQDADPPGTRPAYLFPDAPPTFPQPSPGGRSHRICIRNRPHCGWRDQRGQIVSLHSFRQGLHATASNQETHDRRGERNRLGRRFVFGGNV